MASSNNRTVRLSIGSGLAVAGVLTRLACAGLATAGGIGCSLSTLLTLLSRILAGLA